MMKKLLCEKGLEKEKSESILDWAREVEVSFEEASERLNKEIVEDRVCKVNKASNTMDDMGFFEGHMDLSLHLLFGEENSLVCDEKEDMDFMFIVAKNVQVNIKEYFKFDDCNKCENLRNNYTPLDEKENVLLEEVVNSEGKDENDILENFDKLKVCGESEFLASLECEVEDLMMKNFELVSRLWTDKSWKALKKASYKKSKRIVEFKNQELELLCGKYSTELNKQEDVLKEIVRILEDKFKVRKEGLVQLVQELVDVQYDLNKRVEEGTSLLLENVELGSMCREYLLRLEQLKAEVEMQEELSFINKVSSEESSLVLGTKETVLGKSNDKQNVRLENENSSMVLCLRNRAMRMKDCVYDLKWKDKNLGQLVNNEKAVRREMAEIRVNECKFNKRLDRVQQEKKNLVELLTWLKSSNDYVSKIEKLVNQRTHRQRYFGRNFRIPLVQRVPYNRMCLTSAGHSEMSSTSIPVKR